MNGPSFYRSSFSCDALREITRFIRSLVLEVGAEIALQENNGDWMT